MEGSVSSESNIGFSPQSLERQVLGRSIEWMRRVGHSDGNWPGSLRQSLRQWNPWTNKTASPAKRSQQLGHSSTDSCSDEVTMTTKSAGSVYDMILASSLRSEDSSSSSEFYCSSDPVELSNSNSNTNNKNPFSLPERSSAGLRDIQRHRTEGKQTTIITQFKAAESNQDGKVDINIIMDSESNMSNVQEENSSEEVDPTTDSESKGGANGGISSSGSASGGGGSSGGKGFTSDEAVGAGTPSTLGSAGEADAEISHDVEGAHEEGEGDGEGVEADESDAADDLLILGEEKKDSKSDKKTLNMGHLDKEGIVIGCMNVFADVSKKEFIILLTDKVVEAFLVDPGQFRSIAKRTGCEIEVTRRILNRRIGTYRWVKYLVVTLRGPNLVAIDQCDRLMIKMFPPYKIRKYYPEAAHVSLFVKESYPDNSDLYFNYQRTGPTCAKVGDLYLQSPFGKNVNRSIETTPWKLANPRLLKGILEPRNLPMATTVQHLYPEWGSEKSTFMDESCKWEQAGDLALEIEKKNNLERSMRVKHRKLEAEPLFAGGD